MARKVSGDGRRMDPAKRKEYHRMRYAEKLTRVDACKIAGVSDSWAQKEDRIVAADPSQNLAQNYVKPKQVGMKDRQRLRLAQAALERPPLVYEELSDSAKRQLEDFHYFARVQFGSIQTPWRTAAYARVKKLWESPSKEYLVINAPPGGGKSQFSSHDIPAHLTVQDRHLRGLMGSASDRLAIPYTRKLRHALERVHPLVARDHLKRLGLEVDAESTLVGDFGRFRPDDSSMIWQSHQFQVELIEGTDTGQKEPTWQAYGRGAEVLGNRNDFITWDDLVTKRSMRETTTADFIEWFEDEAETRLEPGGLFIICGQRLGDDLYRNRLDVEILDLDDDGSEITYRQYHHIVFPAHVEDNCTGDHTLGAAPAEFDVETGRPVPGTGCLLEPKRLSWPELTKIKRNNPRKWHVVYQQEDFYDGDRLVPKIWLDGGVDSATKEMYPGCYDHERGMLQIPAELERDAVSYATVDPSGVNSWAIEWWINEPTPDVDHLIELHKGSLSADDLLSYDPARKMYYGMMEEWQKRSVDMNCPIRVWVVEAVAAQKYLLQHRYVDQWMTRWGCSIIAHETHAQNKHDPDRGFWHMRQQYRWGKVRLPYLRGHNFGTLELAQEAQNWTKEQRGGRHGDDALMAQWIGRVNIETIQAMIPAERSSPPSRSAQAPSWMR